jgi:predicted PurR-regulated permease PerM
MQTFEDKSFLLLLVAVSLAFALIVWQFYGAVLWAVVLAVLFAPLNRQLVKSMLPRRNLAAFATVAIIVLIVILPLALLAAVLVDEASMVFRALGPESWILAGPSSESSAPCLPG